MRAMYFGVDNSLRQKHLALEPADSPFIGIVALCGSGASNDGIVDLEANHPPRYAGESGPSVASGPWCVACVERADWR